MVEKRILLVFGTRPEAIKMAPVAQALAANEEFSTRVCVTAQHRQMLDQALELFDIEPDYDLNVMTPDQQLIGITSEVLTRLGPILEDFEPHLVIVHGDTTTTLAGALASYYRGIPLAHVEAGLRTGNMFAPWPEEGNRRATDVLTRLHFAPTEQAKLNLLAEGIDPDWVTVTGNTVIDALLLVHARLTSEPSLRAQLSDDFDMLRDSAPLILITAHRRESFGPGLRRICEAILDLAKEFDDADFVYPVHLNPNVGRPVHELLGNRENIHLLTPLDYLPFVYLMSRAHLILTDSGGIQEEAPALDKPVLVMRDTTERPEGLRSGTLRLVGTDPDAIREAVQTLMHNESEYRRMAQAANPYGDGRASERIVDGIARFLSG